MKTATWTAAQLRGYERLKHILLESVPIPTMPHGDILTGVHTGVLHALRTKGAISCTDIFTGGRVSPDASSCMGWGKETEHQGVSEWRSIAIKQPAPVPSALRRLAGDHHMTTRKITSVEAARFCEHIGCYVEERLVTCSRCSQVIRRGEPRHSFVTLGGPTIVVPTFHCRCIAFAKKEK